MTERIEIHANISAPPEAVFRALTDPEEMTNWFVEHADVSLEDNRYDFWGKYTPEAPQRDQGKNKVLSYESDRNLKFEWAFRGKDTTVSIELAEEGPHTMLKLVHFNLPIRKQGQFAVTDFWDTTIENLKNWVEQKRAGVQCDFSSIQVGDIHLDLDIESTPQEIFDILINPEKLKLYMGENPTVEPEVGGKFSFGWEEGGPVKVLEFEQDKKISYSWEYKPEPDTVVTWSLEESSGKTRLTLVHSGFAPDRRGEDYQIGWLKFMARIKFLAERSQSWERVNIAVHDF